MERPCAWKKYTPQQIEELEELCRGYKQFLSENKTERLCVKTGIKMAEEAGYVDLETVIAEGRELKAGDKVYAANHGKDLMLVNLGNAPLEQGFNILGAHVDSPRLDLKQNPAFEAGDMAYLDTHYYGGVKSYHWVASPLALVGVICKKDGTTVDINIGDKADDPVFTISDLLIHLSADQMKKTLAEGIAGEQLNVILGTEPLEGEGSDLVKLNVMKLLNEKYGLIEEDFLSAELTIVPAGKCREVGLDRSLLGAYGHDDKVCAYPAIRALCDTDDTAHTVMCVLADKEETGSDGVSGMKCSLLVDLVRELCTSLGADDAACRANSMCLSADVNAGFDPNYPEVFEKRNAAIVNCGVVMSKYTGSGGKYSTNDASAEYVGRVRDMFVNDGVLWQTAELGKIDEGGGGTVAMYIANHNIETVDLGVPVLSMHAPFEVISKLDLYQTYKAFCSFCR